MNQEPEATFLAPDWPLIETAPKDGTKICVFEYAEPSPWCKHRYPNGIPTCDVVWWDPSCSPPSWTDGSQSEPYRNPTHWMPLPAATNAADGE